MPSDTLSSVGLAITIVAGMIAMHWLLWRVGRRLPLLLGRRHEAISREEAVEVGNLMLERGILHHVLDEHPFEDSGLFYRFRADERHEGDEGT